MLLDPQRIDALRELGNVRGNNVLDEVVTAYHHESAKALQAMRQSLSKSDWIALKKRAHGLGGSLSMLGARRLVSLCATLQKQAIAGDTAGCQATLHSLAEDNRQLLKTLDTLV